MDLYTPDECDDIPVPPWILPGWFRAKTLTMLSAPGGVGKSNFAQALALSAAAGRAFLNPDAPFRPMSVVYLGLDAAAWDYAHARRRIAKGLGISNHEIEPNPEEWRGGIHYRFNPLMLTDGQFEEIMNMTANPLNVLADLVVVDCLRAVHDGDENDSKAMTSIMRFFRSWSERNCAILLLHHSKKPGEFTSKVGWDSARGSGAIHNSVDSHIVLEPAKARKPKAGTKIINAHWAKGRGGDDTSGVRYRMTWDKEQMTFKAIVRGRPIKKRRPEADEYRIFPHKRESREDDGE